MKAAFLICVVTGALVFAASALAAGNGPTKSVYEHHAKQVQGLVVGKVANTKAAPNVLKAAVVKPSGSLPFTGLDLGFLSAAGVVLLGMGVSLRRVTRKQPGN